MLPYDNDLRFTFQLSCRVVCMVERMRATSTTSPTSEASTDTEDRAIQNALDKKRKKRISFTQNESSKHLKLEGE